MLRARIRKIRPWLFGVLLLCVAILAFSAALPGPYIFDDKVLIEGNHYIHDFSHWAHWFGSSLADSNYDPAQNEHGLHFWRPLVLASFALNWWMGGGAPVWFHATNLLLHGANTLLLWSLFRRWFRMRGLALGLAASFALHPAQTEVVCWISGRGDSLCLLGLLTVLHGLRHIERRPLLGAALGIAGAFFAFLSKEMAVVLPVLVLLDRWANARPASARNFLAKNGASFGVSVLAVAAYLVARSALFSASGEGTQNILSRVPFGLEAFGRCLKLLVWPLDTTLGQAAMRSAHGASVARMDFAVLGGLFLAGGSLGAWLFRKRAPGVLVGWLCFLATWLPVSGLVSHRQLALVSPRYLYIPLIPFLFALGSLVEFSASRLSLRSSRVLRLIGAIALSALFLISVRRSADYSSTQSFWKAEILANPNYIAAQDFFVVRELAQKRPHSALRLALQFLESNRMAGYEALNQGLIFQIVEALSDLTPDVDRKTLGALSRFCDSIVQGQSAEFVLPNRGVHLKFENQESDRLEWHAQRRNILLRSADLLSRLGYDEAAIERLSLALDGCEVCWLLFMKAAVIQARARDFQGAMELAEAFDKYASPLRRGQVRRHLQRALEMSSLVGTPGASPVLTSIFYTELGAFGRAYRAAARAFESPPEGLEAHRALAELALRAGDIEAAKKMAARSMNAETIESFLDAVELPWRDEERSPGLWIPAVRPP